MEKWNHVKMWDYQLTLFIPVHFAFDQRERKWAPIDGVLRSMILNLLIENCSRPIDYPQKDVKHGNLDMIFVSLVQHSLNQWLLSLKRQQNVKKTPIYCNEGTLSLRFDHCYTLPICLVISCWSLREKEKLDSNGPNCFIMVIINWLNIDSHSKFVYSDIAINLSAKVICEFARIILSIAGVWNHGPTLIFS